MSCLISTIDHAIKTVNPKFSREHAEWHAELVRAKQIISDILDAVTGLTFDVYTVDTQEMRDVFGGKGVVYIANMDTVRRLLSARNAAQGGK